jgi:general secretion pathway protein G
MRKRNLQRGFTLIELLLVLVILAVLATIVVTKFSGQSEKAKVTATMQQISNIETALDAFEIQVGRYPTTEEGLNALVDQPNGAKDWAGPYLKQKIGNDPWAHPFIYKQPGVHNPKSYDVYSVGPDGAEGGGDDIGNWKEEK